MTKRKAVIVLVKYPQKGKVKTRLALTTNNNFAVGIYKVIARHIFNEVDKLNNEIDVFIFYTPIESVNKITKWVDKDFFFRVQSGNSLGERMSNAFNEVFEKDYCQVMIIGSDVPDISSKIILESFINLNGSDIVISPSDDGGYSLLGMKKPYNFLFKDIEWSTNNVLKQTVKKINEKGLKLTTICSLNDIDTYDELLEWMEVTENKEIIKEVKILAEKENIKL